MLNQEEVLQFWKDYEVYHDSSEGQTALAQCRLDMAAKSCERVINYLLDASAALERAGKPSNAKRIQELSVMIKRLKDEFYYDEFFG